MVLDWFCWFRWILWLGKMYRWTFLWTLETSSRIPGRHVPVEVWPEDTSTLVGDEDEFAE